MEKISTVCPNCSTRLSVPKELVDRDNLIACPICKYSARVSVFRMGQAGKGGKGPSDEATQLPNSFKLHFKTDVGQIRIVQTGQICELHIGSQVIGRLSSCKKADIQIGSHSYNDPFMSRCHVQIVVINSAKGIEHHLVEIGSKNIIKLNGREIMRGDEIVLNFGDKLTLGQTDVILEETDDESTLIL